MNNMRITIMVVLGALLAAGIIWTAQSSNRMYALDTSGSFRSQAQPEGQILAGLNDTMDFESNQMSKLPSQPPIDARVPAKLEVATFSLG